MNEARKQQEELEIDFRRLALAVWAKKWLILLVTVLSTLVSFFGTRFLITPEYESAAMFYVNNSTISVGDAALSISSGDISASKSLVDSYIVILHTRETLEAVIDYAGVALRYEDLDDMVTAASVNSTEIFQIIVTDTDPVRAEKLADAIAVVLPQRIDRIIDGSTAKIVDAAVLPTKASSPSKLKNTALGMMLGAALTVSVIILRELFTQNIRSEEDLEALCSYPILAAIPDMSLPERGGYTAYEGAERKRRSTDTGGGRTVLAQGEISFFASEAYKLLRTKLRFSFADEKTCHVIGLSSARSGEGKSLSAVNLACVLAELGQKVLLIDGDMRRPSLPEKLPIAQTPGLSGYLSGQYGLEEMLQDCNAAEAAYRFTVIASGCTPPNPVELLSSSKMERLLERLRRDYDYILLDLPPIGEVSDALAVSQLTDGMLLVVRQNGCGRSEFATALRQFEFAETRILGLVLNAARETGSGKYYKRYGNR